MLVSSELLAVAPRRLMQASNRVALCTSLEVLGRIEIVAVIGVIYLSKTKGHSPYLGAETAPRFERSLGQ